MVSPESEFLSAWLEKQQGEVLPLAGNLSIGRTAANQLVVQDERVSRRHAMIHSQAGEFWLVDLGSRNGTQVGERRIFQPVRLRDGDRIRIGSEMFIFHQPGTRGLSESLTQSTMHTRSEIMAVPCWLLVADIEGSTVLSQRVPPDELAMMLGRWFQACRSLIEKRRGHINKYLGDGFLAFWREPGLAGGLIVEAVQALLELQREDSPDFRFALHRGEVLFNSAISPTEENLSGASMSFVFRMEKLAGTLGNKNLFSLASAEPLKAHFNLVSAGEHSLAGFNDKFPFFSIQPQPTGSKTASPPGRSE
jgi:class 3 adenylate cyclase